VEEEEKGTAAAKAKSRYVLLDLAAEGSAKAVN